MTSLETMEQVVGRSDWPLRRRAAWAALFIAMLGWAAMVDPSSGVSREELPIVGTMDA